MSVPFRMQNGTVIDLGSDAFLTVGYKVVPADHLKVGESGIYQTPDGETVHVFRMATRAVQIHDVVVWQ